MNHINDLATWLTEASQVALKGSIAVLVHPFYDPTITPAYLPALQHLVPKIRVPLLVLEDENPERTVRKLREMNLTAPSFLLKTESADTKLEGYGWDTLAHTLHDHGYDRAMLFGGYLNTRPRSGCLIAAQEELVRQGIQTTIREDTTYGIDR